MIHHAAEVGHHRLPTTILQGPTVFHGTREMGTGSKVNEGQAWWLRCSKRGLARKNHRKNEILWKEWTIQRSKTLFLEAWIRQNHHASWRTRTSNLVRSSVIQFPPFIPENNNLSSDSFFNHSMFFTEKTRHVGTNGVKFGPATLGHGRTDVGNRTLSAAAPWGFIPVIVAQMNPLQKFVWWPLLGRGTTQAKTLQRWDPEG